MGELINMQSRTKQIREAREVRAKRKAERENSILQLVIGVPANVVDDAENDEGCPFGDPNVRPTY